MAVRQRETGAWLEDHYAVGERVDLVPRARDRRRLGNWTLVVSMWGYRVEAGPVLAVEAASVLPVSLPGCDRTGSETRSPAAS